MGQARIGQTIVEVRLDGLAADVAARYLAGAGVAGVRVRDRAFAEAARALAPTVDVTVDPTLGVDEPAEPLDLHEPAAAALARGAFVALRALRAALQEDQ